MSASFFWLLWAGFPTNAAGHLSRHTEVRNFTIILFRAVLTRHERRPENIKTSFGLFLSSSSLIFHLGPINNVLFISVSPHTRCDLLCIPC